MKRFLIPAAIAGAIVSSSVFAEPATHGKTREEVRAELVQARQAGAFDAPDATYPAAQLPAAAAAAGESIFFGKCPSIRNSAGICRKRCGCRLTSDSQGVTRWNSSRCASA